VGSLFAAGSVVLLNARYGTPFGAQYTVAIGGGLSLLGALYFVLRLPSIRKAARPMLEKAGVLPPIAAGIESATQAERLELGG
ncbi:MAG TPA: hypothetical protein VGY55_03940, partial [Pirellulales bacterium]|nr:hypothetical protein [Pirellulales bacterium]